MLNNVEYCFELGGVSKCFLMVFDACCMSCFCAPRYPKKTGAFWGKEVYDCLTAALAGLEQDVADRKAWVQLVKRVCQCVALLNTLDKDANQADTGDQAED